MRFQFSQLCSLREFFAIVKEDLFEPARSQWNQMIIILLWNFI